MKTHAAPEGTSYLGTISKPMTTTAMKSSFGVVLAALTFLLPFSAGGNEKAKVAATSTRSIVFTLTEAEADCSSIGTRPCRYRRNIWVVNADASGAKPLTQMKSWTVLSGEPAWSPDGTKIVFTSNRALNGRDAVNANSMRNLWVMNADGSAAKPLAALDGTQGADGPAWSPDGRKIAFSSSRALDGSNAQAGNANIWVVNSDGSDPIPLTRLTPSIRFIMGVGVTWSPNGRKLAFVSDRALDGSNSQNTNKITNIWIINADGSGLMPLTKLIAANTYVSKPVWSPDSHKLAFSWHRALDSINGVEPVSPWNVWVVNVDGSGLMPLTKLKARTMSPDPNWSPDGSKLIYVSDDENIWVMNADGSGAKPLANLTARFISNPAWSPDGSKIAFVYAEGETSNQHTTTNIWVMNADGTSARPVTSSVGIHGQIGWSSGGILDQIGWQP